MSSQHTFPREHSDNDLTLEQRLVMQLSAAIQHDNEQHSVASHATTTSETSENHNDSSKNMLSNEFGELSNFLASLHNVLGSQPHNHETSDIHLSGSEHHDQSGVNLNNVDLGNLNLSNLNLGSLNLGNINLGNLSNIGIQGMHGNLRNIEKVGTAKITDSVSIAESAKTQSTSTISHADLVNIDQSSTEKSSIPLSTPIDPEVSSIQNVLHSLLTGGLPGVLTQPADSVQTTSASSQEALPSTDPPTDGKSLPTQNATDSPKTTSEITEFNNLHNFGLDAADQGLIESLRSAISISTENNKAHDKSLMDSLKKPDSHSDTTKGRSSAIPKTKRMKTSSKADSSSTSQPEFNASDPDTLRAIQQALLSALSPSESSTSLADTLMSNSVSSTNLPEGTSLSQPQIQSFVSPGTHVAVESLNTALKPASSISTSTTESLIDQPGISHKLPESRGRKTVAKKSLPKIVKPTEEDKQKLKEGNAARKRKWRELNLMQNKDNDLRVRIVKRANELYGENDSEKKSKWVEEEFEKRRQRRILRAGINSIVDAAKARAAKAAEQGETNKASLEYSQMRLSEQARTLTQQSKQVAKSHLSQLFRSSNAALESQLHSDKVTVPVAPYMLVASPKRPPYNIYSSTEKSKTLDTVTAEKQTGPSVDMASKDTLTDDQSINSNKTAVETQHTDSRTCDTRVPPEEVENMSKSICSTAEGSKSSEKESSSSSINNNIRESSDHKVDTSHLDERPKHRYRLIGNLNLGVPPNLAAIYHKIRGTDVFRVKS